jgi:hypothetical protein
MNRKRILNLLKNESALIDAKMTLLYLIVEPYEFVSDRWSGRFIAKLFFESIYSCNFVAVNGWWSSIIHL